MTETVTTHPDGPYRPRPIDQPIAVPEDGAGIGGGAAAGDGPSVLDEAKIIAAPEDPSQWAAWRESLRAWRTEAAERIGYDGTLYARPEFAWTQGAYTVAIAWLWDDTLYDHEAGVFTPDAYLEAGEREYGGYDAVVLWHAYPVIGVDERNQFDFYRQVPELRGLIDAFHARGVRVFLDYNPWDTGTRREQSPDADAVAALVAELRRRRRVPRHAQGGRGRDCAPCSTGPARRRARGRVAGAAGADRGPPPVLGAVVRRLAGARACCGPAGSSRGTRCTRPGAGTTITPMSCRPAWLNGAGMLVWDVVFGVWVGWSERDRAVWRAMRPVLRRYQDLFTGGDWSPLDGTPVSPDGVAGPVFASRFAERTAAPCGRSSTARDEPYDRRLARPAARPASRRPRAGSI